MALAELVTGAINSKAMFKVEFTKRTDNLSTDGIAALNAFSSKLYTDNGQKAPANISATTTRTGKDIEGFGGSGFNAQDGIDYPGEEGFLLELDVFGGGAQSSNVAFIKKKYKEQNKLDRQERREAKKQERIKKREHRKSNNPWKIF